MAIHFGRAYEANVANCMPLYPIKLASSTRPVASPDLIVLSPSPFLCLVIIPQHVSQYPYPIAHRSSPN